MRLPIDLVVGPSPDTDRTFESVPAYVADMAERLWNDGQLVRSRLGQAATSMKTRYDARVQPAHALTVGTRVWYYYPRRYSKLSPKWQNLYVGPYTIIRVLDPCNLVIQMSPRSRAMVVHRDKVKPVVDTDAARPGIGSTGHGPVRRTV